MAKIKSQEFVKVCMDGLKHINNLGWYGSDDSITKAKLNNEVYALREVLENILRDVIQDDD